MKFQVADVILWGYNQVIHRSLSKSPRSKERLEIFDLYVCYKVSL